MTPPRGPAVLVVLSGLPGVGKTTLARRASMDLGATYLRIDTIEEAIAESGMEAGPLGYTIAYAVALDNLNGGQTVIADCVNPIEMTRASWRHIAGAAGVPVVDIEIVCSHAAEHKTRVEGRLTVGKTRPSWADVTARRYEVCTRPIHRIDTAGRSEDECLRVLLTIVKSAVT